MVGSIGNVPPSSHGPLGSSGSDSNPGVIDAQASFDAAWAKFQAATPGLAATKAFESSLSTLQTSLVSAIPNPTSAQKALMDEISQLVAMVSNMVNSGGTPSHVAPEISGNGGIDQKLQTLSSTSNISNVSQHKHNKHHR